MSESTTGTDAFDEAIARANKEDVEERATVEKWAKGQVMLRPRDAGVVYTIRPAYGPVHFTVHVARGGNPRDMERYRGSWHANQVARMFEEVPPTEAQVLMDTLRRIRKERDALYDEVLRRGGDASAILRALG